MSPSNRPWSPMEIQERIPQAVDRLHDTVSQLRGYGVASAQAEWAYRKALAQCQISAEGANKEQRDAAAILALTERRSTVPGWEEYHPGLARDLSRNAYSDQRAVVAAVTEEIGVMRTLLVSARRNET